MTGMIPSRAAKLAVAILLTLGAVVLMAGTASAEVIYNNIPSSLPGNFASYGNEAYSMKEFGGQVEFAGTARQNPTVTVAMSSWACQSGSWAGPYECRTPKPNKDFKVPVTFRVYEPGELVNPIVTKTKTFKMPYRPSANPVKCPGPGGRWYDEESHQCFHGKAFTISIKLKARMPKKAIITVSYNTSHHGYSPIGETACNTTTEGCPYDSLNVAILEPAEKKPLEEVGSVPTPEDVYVNSTYPEMFCTSGTEGTFGPASCPVFWEGAQPVIEVSAS